MRGEERTAAMNGEQILGDCKHTRIRLVEKIF